MCEPHRSEANGQGRRGRTPEQQARAERRVKVEAAKLRETLDRRLGRETPAWVIKLAREKV
ncbi:hypothetical protein D477_000809 [Arthrobacter crystallopoietes BAB-32]|uniref:Transposase n=1 Tax=Arthrobacter crystallopoietes BAB-32 TaxID=1246476 RepID=N1V430_9MICC|nr:hypothetical protein [Arthrobacter crystallopoietes]EMY36115.1 hypothetical protein D477_000809 [Arthrobacter crystallopoietes BAB-32]